MAGAACPIGRPSLEQPTTTTTTTATTTTTTTDDNKKNDDNNKNDNRSSVLRQLRPRGGEGASLGSLHEQIELALERVQGDPGFQGYGLNMS